MKLRLGVAVALIALSVGAALFCLFYLERAADDMADAIRAAMAQAAVESLEWEPATDEILRLWERDKAFLHILLPHVNLNELEWTIGALPEYLRQRDKKLYIEQCVRGLQCVNTIKDMERPSLGNIF